MMSNIRDFLKKREVILFLLLFLIASVSFGIGYLAAGEYGKNPIIIEKCSK
ncbi:MAG: hypothetical protein PHP03_00920 [Candidatus Pacebacteria bacterium]|nr:hypothetical protein [Candidatus Paceibacterota bacterium]